MSRRNGAARKVVEISDHRRVTASVSFTPEQLEEVDAAAAHLYRKNRSFLIGDALTYFLAHLRKTRNNGEPFTSAGETPAGRRNRPR